MTLRETLKLGLGALVALAGCATPSGTVVTDPGVVTVVTGDGQTWQLHRGVDVQLNHQPTVGSDDAWNALIRVYDLIGIEPDVIAPAQRQFGASAHRFSRQILKRPASDFFDCGMDPGLDRPLADQVPIRARIVTEVLERASGAELRTTVQGSALRTAGAAGTASCRSKGLLEVLIARMTQELAGGQPWPSVDTAFGLQILGRPYAEGLLFRLAYAYEQGTDHRRPPPEGFPALPPR